MIYEAATAEFQILQKDIAETIDSRYPGRRPRKIVVLWLLATYGSLAACDSRVNVDVAANASAQYSSVLITVKEVWVNESATAAVDDASWLKFPLPESQTLELVDLDSAAMSGLASELAVPPGMYGQIRLFLVDRGEPLTESARSAGATWNDQVTFFDANGVERTLPLELPDAAHGIGIETELEVPLPRDAAFALLTGASNSTPTTGRTLPRSTASGTLPGSMPNGTTLPPAMLPGQRRPGATSTGTIMPGTPVGATAPSPSPTLPGTTVPSPSPTLPGTTVPSPSPTPGTSPGTATDPDEQSVTVDSSIFFDAARDLTAFRFSDRPGVLLNPSLAAYDLDKVANIQARLDVSSITRNIGTGRPDVEVTAEKLDEHTNRRVEIASAPVRADGTFTLYPLPLEDDDATTYDLVIHGPAVTTIVIRGVPIAEGAPVAGSNVALGTITLIASDTYRVNLAAGSAVAPSGARVQFYQTLADDDAPFIVEQRPVDPLTGRFATDEPLSAAPVVIYGTFGESFLLIAAPPIEGAGSYSVAASAPLYGGGDFSSSAVAPPATAGSTATFVVPEIPIPPSAASGTISANVTATTPGKYDSGALLVTHDGAVVTAAPLSAVLAGSQSSAVVTVANVPASASSEFERGLYHLEAWAWSSANPESSFTRQPVSGAADLRAASTANADVTVN